MESKEVLIHYIQEFYEVTLLNSQKSCEQKIEEANQVAQKWEKTSFLASCHDNLQKSAEQNQGKCPAQNCSVEGPAWMPVHHCTVCIYHAAATAAVASVMSDSVQPHRQQPTRLPHPWDSPGKNSGVGCHFLLQCMKGKRESEVTQSCPTLRDPTDCSLPGSSVHGILQARVLEWGAIAFSMYISYVSSNSMQFYVPVLH
uniref:Uncharacterized protein n=1 Tax=Bos mutus grunniens TaxID=30521 RepID=A0A8B9YMQ4_BOSMU